MGFLKHLILKVQSMSDYIIYYIKGKDVRHTKIEHLTDLR